MARGYSRYRTSLIRDQNGKCFYCQLRLGEDATIEHLKSQSEGGGHNYGNLRVAHGRCNSGVGSLSVSEKLRLHHIGYYEGSDAFFRALEELNVRLNKKRKKTKPSHITKQAAWKRYVEAQAARAALPRNLSELFQEPTEPQ